MAEDTIERIEGERKLAENLIITRDNFQEHKDNIIKIINDMEFDNLDPSYEMNLRNGVLMGQHASNCDSCDILHYLMALVINQHRVETDK